MKKTHHTTEQIIRILREAQTVITAVEEKLASLTQ